MAKLRTGQVRLSHAWNVMNKNNEILWTLTLTFTCWPRHPANPEQFVPSQLVLCQLWCSLRGKTDGSVQLCPFYWHITTFSWSKQHYVPLGLHLLSGIWSIWHLQRSCSKLSSHVHLKRDVCAGPHNSILYNQQSGMMTQTHGFVTSVMFLHFCIELHCWASWDLRSVYESFTFTLTGVLIHSKGGAFDNGTFSSPSRVL